MTKGLRNCRCSTMNDKTVTPEMAALYTETRAALLEQIRAAGAVPIKGLSLGQLVEIYRKIEDNRRDA